MASPRNPASLHEASRTRGTRKRRRKPPPPERDSTALVGYDPAQQQAQHSSPRQAASRKQRRAFETLVRKFHEFVCEFDGDGRILSIWSSNVALSPQIRQNLLGRHFRELVGPGDVRSLALLFRRMQSGGSREVCEFPVTLANRHRWFAMNVSSAGRSSRKVPRIALRIHDVTTRHFAEERLFQSQVLLAHAEKIAGMGTWEHDLITGTVVWSKRLFQMHGLKTSARPHRYDEAWKILNYKNKEKLRRDFENAIRAGRPFKFSEPYTLPDASVRILEGLGIPVADPIGRVVRVIGVTRDITSQARAEANVRWLSHQLLTVRSEEQRRMGRELHETTSQTLAALKMTLAQIRRSLQPRNSRVHKLVRYSADLASAAVREVRFVSSLLHPPLLEEAGLVTALKSYTKLFAERGGISVKVHIAESFGRLAKEIELTVFRIVQEALTNVHRHARASSAIVHVELAGNSVLVEIKDNGVGIFHALPESSAKVPLGVGIAGMRERVDQLAGEFDIISAAGEGTTIRALLPIHTSEEIQHERKIDVQRRRGLKTVSNSRRRRPRRRPQRGSLAARN